MKLIFCPSCGDVVRLRGETRFCLCRRSFGRYVDDRLAEYGGLAHPMDFSNSSFQRAFRRDNETRRGFNFQAFFFRRANPNFRPMEV